MYTLKITNIEKVRHQATGTDFLEVTVELSATERRVITPEDLDANPDLSAQDIKVGDEVDLPVVVSRKLGFDPSMDKEAVLAEVTKYLEGYNLEQEQAIEQRKLDAVDDNVQLLKEELTGVEIGTDKENIKKIKP